MNVAQQIAALERDATRYRNMRERYVEYAEKLRKIKTELSAIIDDLDPVFATERRSFTLVVANLYREMEHSEVHIDTDYIRGELTKQEMEWDERDVQYIHKSLKEMAGVKIRKEGRRAILYHEAR